MNGGKEIGEGVDVVDEVPWAIASLVYEDVL